MGVDIIVVTVRLRVRLGVREDAKDSKACYSLLVVSKKLFAKPLAISLGFGFKPADLIICLVIWKERSPVLAKHVERVLISSNKARADIFAR